ncbi:hypothetical protein PF005_g23422 [Phytophthora fragariae]|uniref:Uncharacterized protein n=1 Tax=Phytophthora fragariae TaxID=53985 RepID=A0A6A3RQ31_9STRA|nr:hypothetical protein PF003_g21247 [Phytophthora fragariae]KAE9079637.1 hypothetical protein PF007_g23368 [Phytophthora fragariae]KAE9082434.1 hypothetical protein PF010_g21588 [Phytophthora fragariae]KAE9101606.1 hypothetical protein PF006_g22629 [Phytophthora fragariae]KAE9180101.1 hypothetical protein PF005_g23422 [Phytophthora fragariae]
MARATAETPRSAAHVLSWLRRCRHEELQVERVLDSVRSATGVVPLGGRVGGSDGATPPATPRNSALTLFEAGKDADRGEESTTEQSDEKLWDLLLSSCQLPSSGGQQELRNALETLQDAKDAKRLNVERLQVKFFAARRDFFAVCIELLRAARNPQHPNSQAAEEIVDELLKEGLRGGAAGRDARPPVLPAAEVYRSGSGRTQGACGLGAAVPEGGGAAERTLVVDTCGF